MVGLLFVVVHWLWLVVAFDCWILLVLFDWFDLLFMLVVLLAVFCCGYTSFVYLVSLGSWFWCYCWISCWWPSLVVLICCACYDVVVLVIVCLFTFCFTWLSCWVILFKLIVLGAFLAVVFCVSLRFTFAIYVSSLWFIISWWWVFCLSVDLLLMWFAGLCLYSIRFCVFICFSFCVCFGLCFTVIGWFGYCSLFTVVLFRLCRL